MSIFGQARLYDCKEKKFINEYLHEILYHKETGNIMHNGEIKENWVIVYNWIKTEEDLKELFNEYNGIDKRITDKEEELLKAFRSKDTLKAAASDGMPFGTDVSKPTENKVMDMLSGEGIIKELQQEIARLKNNKLLVMIILDNLGKEEREIVTEKYIYKSKWVKTSRKMYISDRNCRYIRDSAFKKIMTLIA